MSEKKRVYRCLIGGCGFEADSLDEITEHIEHGDRMHEFYLEKLGLSNCWQEGLLNSEELAEQVDDGQTLLTIKRKKKPQPSEWTDYAFDPKYARPYPNYPYYKLSETKEFGCIAEPVFKTRDAKEFLAYLYENHREDTMDWLKNHTKNLLVDRIRLEKGLSTMHLPDDQLERMVNDEVKELLMTNELKAKTPERMAGIIIDQNQKLSRYIQGKGPCPLCGASIQNLTGNARDEFLESKILSALKPTKGITQKYETKWNDQKIDACLRANLHLHLTHKETFKRLYTSGMYVGGLPLWLSSESYLTKKPMIEELMKSGVPADKNLNKAQKDMLNWLKKGGE